MASYISKLALAACTLVSLASPASAGINTWTGVGPDGGEILDLVITPTTPAVAYAVTPTALYRSTDAAQTWTEAALLGNTADFAVHPTQTNRVFLVSNGDLLASTDGGVTRVDVTPPAVTTSVQKIEISVDGALLYVTDGRALYRSSDFGATWTAGATISSNPADFVQSFYIDPTNANRVIAVKTFSTLTITNDAGDHWAAMATPPSIAVNRIAFSPSGPRIWAATADGLWHTSDDGANWTLSGLTGVVSTVAVDPRDASILYAQVGSSIYRSTDGGAQWTPGSGTYSLWSVNAIAFDPQVPERVLIATPNGAWATVDAGANWAPSNQGIVATTPSRFTSTTARTYFVIRGQIYYLDPGASTTGMLDHSALSQALSFNQFDFLYGLHADRLPTGDRLFANEGNYLARSTDGGQTWVRLVDPLFGNFITVDAFGVAPDDPNIVLAATSKGILQSTDGGDHWNATSGTPPNAWISTLAMAPAGVGYAAGGQQIYKTTNAGLSWSQLTLSIPAPEIVLNVLMQPDAVYVGTTSSVYKSSDAGASWTRLSASGGRLAADATGLYVAGASLERSVNGGNTWTTLSKPSSSDATGLQLDPNVPGRLLLGSWYRGAHTYTVAPDLNVTATAQPSVPPAAGVRMEIVLIVTNRGPHVASGVRVNINVAGGRSFYQNSDCSVAAATPSQATCTLAEISSGQSKVVRIESSFETEGTLGITATVAGNETDAAPADNTYSQSWATAVLTLVSTTNTSSGGGGGGALAWWILVALAGLAIERRRSVFYRR